MEDILVSVIIPSYNGANRIGAVLAGLENQTFRNFETVVVIDGSTDNTSELLSNYTGSLKLKIIDQENRGRAGARNAGAEAAIGNLLIFYDDDVMPNSNSVQDHINRLASQSITVGKILEPEDASSEFGRYKAYISRKWLNALASHSITLNSENIFLTAANMGIRREAFVQLNGFDENLRDAEDFDLAVRAYGDGYKIYYLPNNLVTHRSFDTFRAYINRQREYRNAHRQLKVLRIDSPNFSLYTKYDVKKSGLKKIGYFFIPGFVPGVIDTGLFRFLPTYIRFGIYSRIIAALGVYYPKRKID